ncbi:dna-cytosine methyltransferase [hydrocarbon metagenome]|uniref:DNA (cytosine-5-)-methyltransferase n=1 Tax=hydrocarbon metagenome TaxID=938273 RepID=A0A0W8FFS1_9ZZZZ
MQKNGILDIFCGPGGLSLGFALAGFDVVHSIDINAEALSTIRLNHAKIHEAKGEDNYYCAEERDLRTVKAEEILENFEGKNFRVQGIIGGPPCRGFSSANTKTRNPENPHNSLYKDYIRLVNDLQPDFFMFENVVGLLSMGKGEIIRDIEDKLGEELGYVMDKAILDASDYGVPQTRKRVIIIGIKPDRLKPEYDGKVRFPEKTIDKAVTVQEALFDLPAAESGCMQDVYEYPEIEHLSSYARQMRKTPLLNIASPRVLNHSTTKSNDVVLERYKHISQGENWESIPDHLLKDYKDKNRCHSGIYRRLKEDEPSPTINNVRKSMFIHPRQNRGLSVREAARLQSFPDWYEFKGVRDSQYQQVADAVPPLMAKALAEQIRRMLI